MRKTKHTDSETEPSTTVYCPDFHEITVDPWVEPDADWAIVVPYFCAFVMRRDVPFWPSNRVADNVPIQGNAYGDCEVWICIFLHRLCQNLLVGTDHDPLHGGLAYREHMVDYLWKYRLPY
ncbi:hypothetical protein Tco_1454034 [Tanacetum coccineum]